MRRGVNAERRLWKYLVFGILTMGIYAIYFQWTMINDMNTACEYKEPGNRSPHFLIVVLLSVVTCGIYTYVWYYQQGNRLKSAGEKYGLQIEEKGSTYLMWSIFGILLFGIGPLVAFYFLICNSNRVGAAYNELAFQPSGLLNGSANEPNPVPAPPVNNNMGPGPGSFNRSAANEPETLKARSNGTLRFISGEYEGANINLADGEELILGRNGAECQLVFTTMDISRKHCSIKYIASEGYYYITDYSSLGTMLNGSIRLQKNVTTKCTVGTKLSLGEGKNELILQ